MTKTLLQQNKENTTLIQKEILLLLKKSSKLDNDQIFKNIKERFYNNEIQQSNNETVNIIINSVLNADKVTLWEKKELKDNISQDTKDFWIKSNRDLFYYELKYSKFFKEKTDDKKNVYSKKIKYIEAKTTFKPFSFFQSEIEKNQSIIELKDKDLKLYSRIIKSLLNKISNEIEKIKEYIVKWSNDSFEIKIEQEKTIEIADKNGSTLRFYERTKEQYQNRIIVECLYLFKKNLMLLNNNINSLVQYHYF